MKKIIWLLPLAFAIMIASAQKKNDRKTISNLQQHVTHLNCDKLELEGSRTDALIDERAAMYISAQMQQIGLAPSGNQGYLQTFPVKEFLALATNCSMTINNNKLIAGKHFIPLPFSASKPAKGDVIPNVNEPENIWLINIKELDTGKYNNPLDQYLQQTKVAARSGASGVVFYNGEETPATVTQWLEQRVPTTDIPAVWVNDEISIKLAAEDVNGYMITMQIAFTPVKHTATNVIGYINNKAPKTIILGAHYSHPHRLESSNNDTKTRYPTDNAVSTAALLEIARLLATSSLQNSNYVIIAFPGMEHEPSGTTYFTSHSLTDLSQAHYMINIDGIGLFDPDSRLQVGSTSPSTQWGSIIRQAVNNILPLVSDSCKKNLSDYAAFYKQNIPVIYFCTNTLNNTIQPNNNSDKVYYENILNVLKLVYNIIDKTNDLDKQVFTHTIENKIVAPD